MELGDGGLEQAGIVSESKGSGTVTGSHIFAKPGIYSITLTVTDSGSLKTVVTRDVVAYDFSSGFITGAGWFNSPLGAYTNDRTFAGRAHFAIQSRYDRNASVPIGKTIFRLQAANFVFESQSYEWLVINGNRATYQGTGTVNGQGKYQFSVTAYDAGNNGRKSDRRNNGNGRDTITIKIWLHNDASGTDTIIYDNQSGGSNNGKIVGEGSIVIHD
jgi:PKD repeat protein